MTEELQDKTKEELLEVARERDLEGRSGMKKQELVDALSNEAPEGATGDPDSGDGSVSEGGTEVRDAQDLLTPTGVNRPDGESEGADERLEAVEEASPEAADLAAEELDFQGPLHLQDPRERIMTGAVNEDHAKEQERLLANQPEDYVGEVTEAGFDSDGNPLTAQRAPNPGFVSEGQEEVSE